jgi:hypothetical protein
MGGFTIGLFFTGASAYFTTCCPPSVLAPGSSTSRGVPTGTVLKPMYVCVLHYFALCIVGTADLLLKYGLFDVLYLPGLGEFLVNEREPSEII